MQRLSRDCAARGPAPWPRSRRPRVRSCHPAARQPKRETRSPSSDAWAGWSYSSVHLPEHDVDRAEDRRDIRQQVAAAEEIHRLEMGEARGADFALVGLVGAVSDEIDAELALRGLDGGINLACRYVV